MLTAFTEIRRIPHSIKTAVIVIFILLLFIWLLLPFIPVNEAFPFASVGVRWAVTGLVALAILVWLSIAFVQRHKGQVFSVIGEGFKRFFKKIGAFFVRSWETLRERYYDLHDHFRKKQKYRHLKRLPWYLVIGQQPEKQTALIQAMGLDSNLPSSLTQEIERYKTRFPQISWHFAREAVLLTFSQELFHNPEEWADFLRLLRRERRKLPFNGILLSVEIAELLKETSENAKDFWETFQLPLQGIQQEFKASLPLYLLVNQGGALAGFQSFFESFQPEELSQVWGLAFPFGKSVGEEERRSAFFNEAYEAMLSRLRQRLIRLFKTTIPLSKAAAIYAFPQQLALLKKPIERFLSKGSSLMPRRKSFQWRGVYFINLREKDTQPFDFLRELVHNTFNLTLSEGLQGTTVHTEEAFTRHVLLEAILPEAVLLGKSERYYRWKQIFYRTLSGLCVVSALWIAWLFYAEAKLNDENLPHLQQNLQLYQSESSSLASRGYTLPSVLPNFSALENARLLYASPQYPTFPLLMASWKMREALNQLENQAFQTLFWPRIANGLEQKLQEKIEDQNLLYAYFKGYLVFSPVDAVHPEVLRVPLAYLWRQTYATDPAIEQTLRTLLDQGLHYPIKKFSLNQPLVARLRTQLKQMSPTERAYGLLFLQADLSSSQDIDFNQALAPYFGQVFSAYPPSLKISAFYTQKGFKHIFLNQYEAIAQEVAEDNQTVGISQTNLSSEVEQLKTALEQAYYTHYTQAWTQALEAVHIRDFTTLDEAIAGLNALTLHESPIPNLLELVSENTAKVRHGQVKVAQDFKPGNQYVHHLPWWSPWKKTEKVLLQLRDYLQKLQLDPHPDQASFNAAVAIVQGKEANPMAQLIELADQSPEPVQRWLKELSDRLWQVILNGAYREMNQAWQSQILSVYDPWIRGRYPFSAQSELDVKVEAFNNVFSAGGLLEQYFNQYLKPFINTDQSPWVYYQTKGLSSRLPDRIIPLFQTAKKIQLSFFAEQSKNAQLSLTFQPLALDSRASSVQLLLGSQTLFYSHGPQANTQISWPFPANVETVRVVLTTFENGQFSRQATGPWALFRLLETGTLKRNGAQDGSYFLTFHFRDYSVSYQIIGPSNPALFTLDSLKNYELPAVIAPIHGAMTTPVVESKTSPPVPKKVSRHEHHLRHSTLARPHSS